MLVSGFFNFCLSNFYCLNFSLLLIKELSSQKNCFASIWVSAVNQTVVLILFHIHGNVWVLQSLDKMTILKLNRTCFFFFWILSNFLSLFCLKKWHCADNDLSNYELKRMVFIFSCKKSSSYKLVMSSYRDTLGVYHTSSNLHSIFSSPLGAKPKYIQRSEKCFIKKKNV